jgi:hypothetical protein
LTPFSRISTSTTPITPPIATDAEAQRTRSVGYTAMAADEAREAEAADWTEALLGDVADEPKRGH